VNAQRRSRQFLTAAATAPTAEPAAQPAPEKPATSRRLGAKTSEAPTEAPSRTAFTWRRTPQQGIIMDELALKLKREVGRAKLDHAEILAALVDLAAESPAVFGALAARLQP
jgi:hypothetical protein